MLPLRARVDLGAMAMKRYSAFPKAPALLEPHYQIVLCHIQDTRWASLTPLQRCSRCIQQPQPTGPISQGYLKRYFDNRIACFIESYLLFSLLDIFCLSLFFSITLPNCQLIHRCPRQVSLLFSLHFITLLVGHGVL